MKCEVCGTKNRSSAKFCKNCGYKFRNPAPSKDPVKSRIASGTPPKSDRSGKLGGFLSKLGKKKGTPKRDFPQLITSTESPPEGLGKKVAFLITKVNELEGKLESMEPPEPSSGSPESFEKYHELLRLIRAAEMRIDGIEREKDQLAKSDELESLKRRMETGIKEIIHLRESMFKQESRLNELWKLRKVMGDQQRKFREIGDVLEDILNLKMKAGKKSQPETGKSEWSGDDELFEDLISRLDTGKRKLQKIVDEMNERSPVVIE